MEGLTISAFTFKISADGRYPDGIEAHVLDVVKVVDHTLPGASTVNTV